MSAASERPLRIAYLRLLQATLALHMEEMNDTNLGGGPHLLDIRKGINAARTKIERLAVAEGIDLSNDEEDA